MCIFWLVCVCGSEWVDVVGCFFVLIVEVGVLLVICVVMWCG